MTQHDDDDAPRLAEIARNIADFRQEFRAFTGEVVRKDVYSAHMAAIQMQLDRLAKENSQLELDMERERQEKTADRREVRKALLTASLSVVVAVLVLIAEIVIK